MAEREAGRSAEKRKQGSEGKRNRRVTEERKWGRGKRVEGGGGAD